VWAVVARTGDDVVALEFAIDIVCEIIRNDTRMRHQFDFLARAPELHSDSFEARVIAFNNLVELLKGLPVEARRSSACSAVVAIAAFLVGRSTSHEFLVRRNLEFFPFGPIWFGLLAGLVGSNYWDVTWARFAKGVERQLRSKFRWEEAAGYDLCWAEYAWYAATFDDRNFSQIPKLLPKVLSVEVMPGATCQLRLSAVPTAPVKDGRSPLGQAPQVAVARSDTLTLLEQVVKLGIAAAESIKQQKKAENKSIPSDAVPPQAGLFERSSTSTRSRAKRPKGGG
jgi:hypothetical protein